MNVGPGPDIHLHISFETVFYIACVSVTNSKSLLDKNGFKFGFLFKKRKHYFNEDHHLDELDDPNRGLN